MTARIETKPKKIERNGEQPQDKCSDRIAVARGAGRRCFGWRQRFGHPVIVRSAEGRAGRVEPSW